jgi:hypothetical protein
MHKEEMHQHRHHNRHHHDKKMTIDPHNHLHAMIGIVDNPAGFALYSDPIHQKQKEDHSDELFSKVPTVTMSNNRLLPQVAFGVAGHHIEHKEIPLIVSRLLQYASSENEGGGGIAMIDAVMDESVAREDEKLESNMATTAVAVVGRAVNYFAKEGNRVLSSEDAAAVANRSNGKSFDYENRLEVHLLVSLTGAQLGRENTLKALSDLSYHQFMIWKVWMPRRGKPIRLIEESIRDCLSCYDYQTVEMTNKNWCHVHLIKQQIRRQYKDGLIHMAYLKSCMMQTFSTVLA